MDKTMKQKAARTAVDGFKVVERLYRHGYQILTALKDEIKMAQNLKSESPMYNNSQSATDPKSWLYHFKGLYLAYKKISLDEYIKTQGPILFLQASLYNPTDKEPLLRYGVIQNISDLKTWKGARFDDYFRQIIGELHSEPRSGKIKTSHCIGATKFDEKPLLDIREDQDVLALAGIIGEKYMPYLEEK